MKKILALYLPQYHSIPENDEWWGMGYTEWTAVRGAKPLFGNHMQPRIPLNGNYYDLSDENGMTWKWQAELAKQYGVYGFAIYHYWFGNGKTLLEKPMEILLRHKEIDVKYSIVWANETWTRTWYGMASKVLIEQEYCDDEDWEAHFNYLLQFFNDDRYIKIENRPVIHIYKTKYIVKFKEMMTLWNRLAIKNGFDGVYVVVGNTINGVEDRRESFDAYYNFEPGFSQKFKSSIFEKSMRKTGILIRTMYNKVLRKEKLERIENIDNVYRAIKRQETSCEGKKVYLGTFPSWDNTPRRGYKGSYFKNSSPDKFYHSLKNVYERTLEGDFVYINAWNEWGEGCYLEPDTVNGYAYLDMIKRVVDEEESCSDVK